MLHKHNLFLLVSYNGGIMEMGTLVFGLFIGAIGGAAAGYSLGVMGQVNTILRLLKEFKSEGQDHKWLK